MDYLPARSCKVIQRFNGYKFAEPSISDKEIYGYFLHFIQDLPSGDLQVALIKNKQECVAFLTRCIRKAGRKLHTKSLLQNGKDSRRKSAAVGKDYVPSPVHDQSTVQPSQSAYKNRQLIVQLLQSEKETDELQELVENLWAEDAASTTALGDVDKYCQWLGLTEGCDNLQTLKNIMTLCFKSLQDAAEEIITRKLKKRARKRIEPLVNFLQMCHLRRTRFGEGFGSYPSYADLVVAMLSVYLDLFIIAHSEEEVMRKEQRQMCKLVKTLTMDMGEKSLDVVLQMSAARSGNSAYLSPLIRYLLTAKPAKKNHSHYLRYLLVMCMWRSTLSGFEDLVTEARLIRAPKGFVEWATEWQPELDGEFPDDRKFKGCTVTAFLLDDASEDTLSLLQDVIVNFERKSDTDEETEEQMESEDEHPAKKPKKKKNKKKAAVTSTKVDDLPKESEDVHFTIDTGNREMSAADLSDPESSEKKRKRKLSEEAVEVFAFTSLGNMDTSNVFKSDSLFVVDRGEKKKRNVLSPETAAEPKRKKKMRDSDTNQIQETSVSSPKADDDSADGISFFFDRGEETKKSDEPKKKKKKEKTTKTDAGDKGTVRKGSAETMQENLTMLQPESGDGASPRQDSTVLFSIDRGSKKGDHSDSQPAEAEPALVRTADAGRASLLQKGASSERAELSPETVVVKAATAEEQSSEMELSNSGKRQKKRRSRNSSSEVQHPWTQNSELESVQTFSADVESVSEHNTSTSSFSRKSAAQKASTSPMKSSTTSFRISETLPSDVDMVPESDVEVANDNTHPSSSSQMIVPNSFSDNQNETPLVPDLSVHLKPMQPRSDTKRKRNSNLLSRSPKASKSESEGLSEKRDDSVNVENLAKQKSKKNSVSPTTNGETKTAVRIAGQSEPETQRKSTKKDKSPAFSLLPNESVEESKEGDEKSKHSKIPQEVPRLKEKNRKSTTPVSRRTRFQRKSVASSTPVSSKSFQSTDSEMKAAATMQRNEKKTKSQIKPISETEDNKRDQVSHLHLDSSVSSHESAVAASSRSRKSKVVTSKDADPSPDSAAKSGRSLPTNKKSTSLLSDLQKKAERRAAGPDMKTADNSKRQSTRQESKSSTRFTELKELAESTVVSPSSKAPRNKDRRSTEDTEKSAVEVGGKKSPSNSPGKASRQNALKTSASSGHDIGTRSKTPMKGYNLRRSGKLK